MTVTLITGANKGLGFEAARQLGAAGHQVWIGARDPGRGKAAAAELGARFVQLDVTDDASVAAAASTAGELDVLVNNAGIAGQVTDLTGATAGHMRDVFETNVFGAVRVLHACLPVLERSAQPVVVNVSSGLGSLTAAADLSSPLAGFAMAYSATKAALNMMTIKYAATFPAMRINCVNPGYTATDLNAGRGTQAVSEGARVITDYAMIGPDGLTGGFFSSDGPEPWFRVTASAAPAARTAPRPAGPAPWRR